MNPGGDAAEQVVRLSLEGMEVTARIAGTGAKNIALLLYATLKQEQKTKGRARLTGMLKSGKELKVYTITQKDLGKFAKEAKRYGVLYCVLRDRANPDPNAAVDVIARAEDASKIQRITERFGLMTRSKAEVAIEKERDRLFGNPNQARAERGRLSGPGSGKGERRLSSTYVSRQPSVRAKLELYKSELAKANAEKMAERAKGAVSKGVAR